MSLTLRPASLTALVATCFALGCGTVSSAGLATGEITANIAVHVDDPPAEPQTVFNVSFLRGPGHSVVLAEGDVLVVDTDKEKGVTLQLDDSPLAIGNKTYWRALPGVDRHEVTVLLKRKDGEVATSTVTIPPAFVVTAPAPNAKVPFSAGKIEITWSNPTAGAVLDAVAYECGHVPPLKGSTTIPLDGGTISVPMSMVFASAPTAPTCVSVDVSRKLDGTVSPLFAVAKPGGVPSTMQGVRHARVDVTVTP